MQQNLQPKPIKTKKSNLRRNKMRPFLIIGKRWGAFAAAYTNRRLIYTGAEGYYNGKRQPAGENIPLGERGSKLFKPKNEGE